jgi:hypothetical protein
MAILQNRQLIEDQKKKPLAPASVSNPLGAQQAGANPDQAKMAGSSAQKGNAVRQSVKAATAATPQSVAQEAQKRGPTAAAQTSSSMADRLSKIGGLNERVDQMVAQKLGAVEQSTSANLNVNLEGRGISPEQEAAIKAYIQAVNTNDPNLPALEDSMNTVLKAGGVADPTTYLKDMGVNVGQQLQEAAKVAINPDMPLASLAQNGEDFASTLGYDGGKESLAADLGISVADLGTMTLSQLQQKVKDVEEQHFSHVEQLRSELASASPNRAAQIRNELAELGATGQAAVDQSVNALNNQLESAEEVEFAGKTYTVGDLLGNSAISDVISGAVDNPEELAALQQSEPGMANWITANKSKLDALVNNIKASTEEGKQRQKAFTDSTKEFSPELTKLITGMSDEDLAYVSQSELDKATQAITNSGLAQAIKGDPELATVINKSLGNKDLITKLSGMSAEDIKAAHSMAIETRQGGPLTAFLGETTDDFMLDPDKVALYKEVKPVLDTLGPTLSAKFAQSEELKSLITDGSVGEVEAAYLAEFPNEMDDIVKQQATAKQIADLDTPQEVANLFGLKDEAELKSYIKWMEDSAKWGDKAAGEQLVKIRSLLGTQDGSIDIATVKNNLSNLAGAGKPLMEVMKDNLNKMPEALGQVSHTNVMKPSPAAEDAKKSWANAFGAFGNDVAWEEAQAKFPAIMADGHITPKEWLNLTANRNNNSATYPQLATLYDTFKNAGLLDESTPAPTPPKAVAPKAPTREPLKRETATPVAEPAPTNKFKNAAAEKEAGAIGLNPYEYDLLTRYINNPGFRAFASSAELRHLEKIIPLWQKYQRLRGTATNGNSSRRN